MRGAIHNETEGQLPKRGAVYNIVRGRIVIGHPGPSLYESVRLPTGESAALWVAAHALDIYNDLDTIRTVCKGHQQEPTWESFSPGQGYPPGVSYLFKDESVNNMNRNTLKTNHSDKIPPAPVYVDKVLEWIAAQFKDQTMFPDLNCASDFTDLMKTPSFAALCGAIIRRIFRVYGILYECFTKKLEQLDMMPHVNFCFKHFIFFVTEFGLLPERQYAASESLATRVKLRQEQYNEAKDRHHAPTGHK